MLPEVLGILLLSPQVKVTTGGQQMGLHSMFLTILLAVGEGQVQLVRLFLVQPLREMEVPELHLQFQAHL